MKRSLAASRRSELTAPPPRKQGEIAIIGKSRSWLDPSTSMTDAELVIAGDMTGGEILTGPLSSLSPGYTIRNRLVGVDP